MLFFLIIHILIFLYLLWRLVLPLRVGLALKCGLVLLLLLASLHYLVRAAFDSLSTPEIPGILITLEGWLYGLALFLTALTLARDLALLLRKFLASGPKRRSRSSFSAGRRAALLAGLAGRTGQLCCEAGRKPAGRAQL